VKPYALVMGVPARQVGWICYCGVRLPENSHPCCAACGRQYHIENGECKPSISTNSTKPAAVAAVALGD
jgi:UDP-2-acetamido-3-amino-2,3-dideoxy-glucuronate N-acetyltransferase